jgi:C-methyltransferase-like protein/putative zinc binding protein/methyltransferase family protein
VVSILDEMITPAPTVGGTHCRFCETPLELTMVDLGKSPLCESFLPADRVEEMEPFYPLHVRVCTKCWLAQLPSFVPPDEIFHEYAYFSAYSASWVEHAHTYVNMITERLSLGHDSLVVELASNDGYLLQHFLPKGVPVLGIDPAANVAVAAEERGVPTLVEFFGVELAERLVRERGHADLMLGNNVLAQVPDLNDFVHGVAILLAERGTATFEFPHLARLLEGLQYDTIYHEHFGYFSLTTIREVFAAHGLTLVDVEELHSHGGSLRVYAQHAAAGGAPAPAVDALVAREEAEGLLDPDCYHAFAREVAESKRRLLELLIRLKREGNQVVGYGAPGKGNTLLNYCGVGTDFLDYTVDRNPYKHGRFTPGMQIPIQPPERIAETRPDAILILPWNLAREIAAQLAYTEDWGAQLIVPIPFATVLEPRRIDG